jgi:hypothetical protein
VSPTKQITPQGPKRKHVSDSSESSDIGAIKLEPVTPTNKSEDKDGPSSPPMPSRTKKRRMLVAESGSDEDKVHSSSSEAVAVPHRRILGRLAFVASDSSEEPSELSSKRRSITKGKAQKHDSDEDLSEEVDKHRTLLDLLSKNPSLTLSRTRYH